VSLTQAEKQRLAGSLAEAVRAVASADASALQAQLPASEQAAEIEALLEAAQRVALRARDLRAGVQELRDTLERGRLSTLNAALEGTRLSEAAGKVVIAMTEELRSLLGRCENVLDEHAARVAELERERERWVLTLGPLADAARAVDADVSSALEQQRAGRGALAELTHDLRELLGVDPELGGLMARGERETQDLLSTLEALEARGATEEAEQLRSRVTALAKAYGPGQS